MSNTSSPPPPITTRGIQRQFFITTQQVVTDEKTGLSFSTELYLYNEEYVGWVVDVKQATPFKNYALAQGYIEAELEDGYYSIKLVFHKGKKKQK